MRTKRRPQQPWHSADGPETFSLPLELMMGSVAAVAAPGRRSSSSADPSGCSGWHRRLSSAHSSPSSRALSLDDVKYLVGKTCDWFLNERLGLHDGCVERLAHRQAFWLRRGVLVEGHDGRHQNRADGIARLWSRCDTRLFVASFFVMAPRDASRPILSEAVPSNRHSHRGGSHGLKIS